MAKTINTFDQNQQNRTDLTIKELSRAKHGSHRLLDSQIETLLVEARELAKKGDKQFDGVEISFYDALQVPKGELTE